MGRSEMRFAITLFNQRTSPDQPVDEVFDLVLELVTIADQSPDIEVVWLGEHHVHEYVFCPNPLIQLTQWAEHTRRVRLGTAILTVPYWHPIRFASEVAMTDVMTKGR